MTAPTPKPDKIPDRRRSRKPQFAILIASACVTFAIFAVALTQVLPPPHTKADNMVIGTLSTLAALITIFTGLVLGRGRSR